MKRNYAFVGVFLVLMFVVVLFVVSSKRNESTIQSFEACAQAGRPIMESYPRQCKTNDGRTFREDIGNALEKKDLIVLDSPRPLEKVSSPLIISGKARGNWFFEASFPVLLVDEQNNEVGRGIAQAGGEWMTTNFVPFSATLTFVSKPEGLHKGTRKGTLILKKDNPSGDPVRDDALVVPVSF